MTGDWRKIEAAIADFLEQEGLTVSTESGDRIVECSYNDDGDPINTANVTMLARELADLK